MPVIMFSLSDKTVSYELARKVTKEDLYGTLKRLVVRGDEILQRGYLTADGHSVPGTAISNQRLDPEGTPVEVEEILYDGEPRDPQPSSFEEPAPIESVPLSALATFCVSDVYPLSGDGGLSPGLYSTWFSYRKAPERKDAYLLVKEGGVFLLIGYAKNSPFVGQVVPYELFDAEETPGAGDDDEDMDFSMM
jgi:hypothetical protein